MSAKSKIEWTENTWNPMTGCIKISDGCENCYAWCIDLSVWPKICNSSGTARSFLKAYSDLSGKKIYYKLSNYDAYWIFRRTEPPVQTLVPISPPCAGL